MSQVSLPARPNAGGLDGRGVLLTLVAFFGVILAVNMALLYFALSTHSGLVAKEPYRKGLNYNARIAAHERQAALGWTTDLVVARDGAVSFALLDATGAPVAGLHLSAVLIRPTTSREDIRLAFNESGYGRYVAEAGALEPGVWQIDVEARLAAAGGEDASEPVYRERRRLWLKP